MATHDDAYLSRVTDYWRRVQVAAALESLKDERDSSDEEEGREEKIIRSNYSYEEFRLGKCPTAVYTQAFARLDRERELAHQKALERNPNAKPAEPAVHIPVVFSPFGLHIDAERDSIHVLFGAALVDRRGNMTVEDVESDLPPIWVGRDYLAPSDGIENELVPLADADAYSDAVTSKLRALGTWPVEWEPMLRAFDEIWENAAARIDRPQAIPLYDSLIAQYSKRPGWIRFERKDPKRIDIIRMYQKLAEQITAKKTPPLYREAVLAEHSNVFNARRGELHLGQMGGKNPLKPSQRDSLLAYLQTPAGHVAAINGPPGTGKTTLLQSVIACELVSAALRQGEAPLYVAAAATNQAVSNIIKAFREATDDLKDPLADRWIPGLKRRYGAYFRGSKGESLRLARGSIVCLPMQFGTHKDYDEDGIAKLRSDIENRNKQGEEVSVDMFLPLAESKIVASEFLATASEKLAAKKPFGTLDEFLSHIHASIVETTKRIEIYAKAADTFVAELLRLDLLKHETFDKAARFADLNLQGAEARYESTKESVTAERDADAKAEAKEKAEEDKVLQKFDEVETKKEAEAAKVEDDTISAIQAKIDKIEEGLLEYRPLRPPTSMLGWLAEFLPWVKNRKLLELQALAKKVRRNKNEAIGTTIPELRAFIESVSCGADQLEIQQGAIRAERSKRHQLQKSQRDAVVAEISKTRQNRQINLLERDVPRNKRLQSAAAALQLASAAKQSLHNGRSKFMKDCGREVGSEIPPFDKILGHVDTTLRLRAFLLASHYWEGRFLRDGGKAGWRSQANRYAAFRLIAMLTPCFVSTFDKLGTSFNIMRSGETHPMWSFADALIVDEAGQASPDKGAFAFSFAKKALVVGDELQLPPVNSLDAVTILTSLAESANLTNDEFAAEHGMMTGVVGIQKKPGSLMRMASQSAYYHFTENTRGMWLRDHFRCDPRIIKYSNQIWYTGDTSLVPCRPEQEDAPLPHFGHVHVPGKFNNKSNAAEVRAIMEWINEHGEMLQQHYKLPLHEIVAVLTPFTNQKFALWNARDKSFRWSKQYAAPHGITMGTVHALQGAERPVVLFSTVYDQPKPNYFFDFEHTLLNVAVSRAKDSFIVFGNKRLFEPGREEIRRPSTFLTAHLFAPNPKKIPQISVAS